jgi:integrase
MRLGLLARNVCELVSPPSVVHKEIKSLTLKQIQVLLEATKGHHLEALFILAVTTGMRRGELFGLKWQDVDFAKGALYVRRALTRMPTGLGYIERRSDSLLLTDQRQHTNAYLIEGFLREPIFIELIFRNSFSLKRSDYDDISLLINSSRFCMSVIVCPAASWGKSVSSSTSMACSIWMTASSLRLR